MAWIFQLAAECGEKRQDAEIFARHFDGYKLVLSDDFQSSCRTHLYQDEEGNWWCLVNPSGVSKTGILNEKDAQQMTELGVHIYDHLRTSPYFRFALVGVETEMFRTFSELVQENSKDILFDGIVISQELLEKIGGRSEFEPFRLGYFWKPYKGEKFDNC